jgi:hypothetical protein
MALGAGKAVNDASYQLRTATRRAKSDVANKLVSMFLHELSRRIGQDWPIRVDGAEYEQLVRAKFGNRCPYCSADLGVAPPVIEHLDGLNRYRVGLHLPGNVLVACKRCNSEKRRDDSRQALSLAHTGWESFLSHDGLRCEAECHSCHYWNGIWPNQSEKTINLTASLDKIRSFRSQFAEFQEILPLASQVLPELLKKLYSDCQSFAESEIRSLLGQVESSLINQRKAQPRNR